METKNLLQSILTGGGTKAVTMVTQFLCIGLISESIGIKSYGEYFFYITHYGWLALLSYGLNTHLTRENIKKDYRDNIESINIEKAIAILSAFQICALVIYVISTKGFCFFSAEDCKKNVELNLSIIFIVALTSYLGVVDSIRISRHKQVVTNAINLLCNLAAMCGVYLYSKTEGVDPYKYALIMLGVPVVVKLIFSIKIILEIIERHKNIFSIDMGFYISHLKEVSPLFLVSLGVYLSQGGVISVARIVMPDYMLGQIALVIQFVGLMYTSYGLFTVAMWPFIADAKEKKKLKWIENISNTAKLIAMVYSAVGFFVFAVFGTDIIKVWSGVSLELNNQYIILTAAAFVFSIFNMYRASLLLAYGKYWVLATAALFEGGVVCLAVYNLYEYFGENCYPAAILASSVLFTMPFYKHHLTVAAYERK